MPLMPETDDWSYDDAFTADTDPTGDKDKVRFWLQDTDESVRLLSDSEIQYLVDSWKPKYDSLLYVAAVGAETIAAKFAGVISVSADGVTVGTADLSQRYADLAVRLRALYKQGQVGGEIDIANLMAGTTVDESIDPLNFGIGLHDNPEAGLQAYGGHRIDPWAQALNR